MPLVSSACMPSPLPRQVRWNLFARTISINVGLPQLHGGSAPALHFSRPAQRSLTLWPARSPSRLATLYTESSDRFVASAVVSVATGRSEPVPGRELHPLKSSAFSRRTCNSLLAHLCLAARGPRLVFGMAAWATPTLRLALMVENLKTSGLYRVSTLLANAPQRNGPQCWLSSSLPSTLSRTCVARPKKASDHTHGLFAQNILPRPWQTLEVP